MKNRKLRDILVTVIEEAGVTSGTDKVTGALLYEVAVKVSYSEAHDSVAHTPGNSSSKVASMQYPKNAVQYRPHLLQQYVVPGVLKVNLLFNKVEKSTTTVHSFK